MAVVLAMTEIVTVTVNMIVNTAMTVNLNVSFLVTTSAAFAYASSSHTLASRGVITGSLQYIVRGQP